VDRAEDVARLGLLRQACRRAEHEHLVALDRRGVVGQDDQARLRAGELQLVHVHGGSQRAEVQDRDARVQLGDGGGNPLVGDVRPDDPDVRVVLDEREQPAGDQILELGDHDGDCRPRFHPRFLQIGRG
jgi:hypothetical protein